MAVVILLVICTKAYSPAARRSGAGCRPGHAAVAFGGWAAITFVTQGYDNQVLISTLVFVMALLVVQTRVEARVHTTLEVVLRRRAGGDGHRRDLPAS